MLKYFLDTEISVVLITLFPTLIHTMLKPEGGAHSMSILSPIPFLAIDDEYTPTRRGGAWCNTLMQIDVAVLLLPIHHAFLRSSGPSGTSHVSRRASCTDAAPSSPSTSPL